MANQVQIPVIQGAGAATTQVQTNTNKVFTNLNNQITSLTSQINQTTIIGEVKLADLGVAQFQTQAGDNWVLANGQSSMGTAFSKLTGNNVVPTISIAGLMAFIRVN